VGKLRDLGCVQAAFHASMLFLLVRIVGEIHKISSEFDTIQLLADTEFSLWYFSSTNSSSFSLPRQERRSQAHNNPTLKTSLNL
jgi:hypothetical protein